MEKTELIDILNAFISSSIEIIEQTTGIEMHKGKIEKRSGCLEASGVVTILDLVGKEKGKVLLNMPIDTAKAIASRINEEELEDMDERVLFALTELTNMISGGVITTINNKYRDFSLRLTPPGVFWGESVEISSTNFNVLSITMTSEVGNIGVNVGFQGVNL